LGAMASVKLLVIENMPRLLAACLLRLDRQ